MLITARGNNRYWLGLKLQKESLIVDTLKKEELLFLLLEQEIHISQLIQQLHLEQQKLKLM